MTVTASDLISEQEVEAVIQERTRAMHQFRRAFRDDDATDISSNSKTFPVPDDTLEDDMSKVTEDSDYPRSALAHDGVDADYTKKGFEVAISDEAADDSVIDIILDITEEMANAAEAHLDSKAYAVLNAHNNATTVGDSANSLNYEALVDAYAELVNQRYNRDRFELYLSTYAWADLMKDEHFIQATELGDETVRGGVLNMGVGVPFYETNTGDLGESEAFLVDTGIYGYESTRWQQEVTQYRDEQHDRDVFKVRVRNDFLATNPNAALLLEGGVA